MKKNIIGKRRILTITILFALFWIPSCDRLHHEFSQKDLNEQSILSLVWFQNASEARALCYQAFNIARVMFDTAMENASFGKKPAVVADIDETLLDTSPWQAGLTGEDLAYPAGWVEWCNTALAEAVPGSVAFLNHAVEHGADVFYISNRDEALKSATMKNMARLGFPQVLEDHVLLRKETSDKEPRRQLVGGEHSIILLIGDNLNDFSSFFNNKNIEERNAAVDSLREDFGIKFIVLPNPLYGDWESAVYRYNRNLTPEEKSRVRKESLKKWKVS